MSTLATPEVLEMRTAVARYIDAHPEEHDQNEWAFRDPEGCGSTMCVAGTAVHLAGYTIDYNARGYASFCISPDGKRVMIDDVAAPLLGLDYDQAARLFGAQNERARNVIRALAADADPNEVLR
ncbi:hypothetical protein SEA_OBLADI_63 [Gordonia phage ObLaDi]|uniref:Uncharacterized protein n=1 Tax=Gordonia phage ObLaDi TaxID=2978487 RepID=A0A977KLP2_9CAUD|nr:hypothetical protein SEA_OBLADI_63 [Gordonia phage ObLaDi]